MVGSTSPGKGIDQSLYAGISGTWLLAQVNRIALLIEAGTGGAKPPLLDAATTIQLATTTTVRGMFGTMIATTNSTLFMTNWAESTGTNSAMDQMVMTDHMIAVRHKMAVLRAVRRATDGTRLATSCTVAHATSWAGQRCHRPIGAGRALLQATQTVGLLIECFVKAWPDQFATGNTIDKAAFTEALPTTLATTDLRAILLAAGATECTITTDKDGFALLGADMIKA